MEQEKQKASKLKGKSKIHFTDDMMYIWKNIKKVLELIKSVKLQDTESIYKTLCKIENTNSKRYVLPVFITAYL